MSEERFVKIDQIVFREDLYPRLKPNPKTIQEYAENVEKLPPVTINQNNILIDGYHRLKAHETASLDQINCEIIETQSEIEIEMLAVEKNSIHGDRLTTDRKRAYACKWFGTHSEDIICNKLKITSRTYRMYTEDVRRQSEKEIKQKIYDLYLACYTQQEIADQVGIDQSQGSRQIAGFMQNGNISDLHIFRNFEPEIYAIWNFGKATNKTKVFGSIPPEIIDNLLYYYTKPFDVVFDPFGGGGSTIDKCIERKRRYYVSDLTPIPARNDIRQHDVVSGLPGNLPVPDLVFLDPPYWQQAKGKYSDKETDLGNCSLDDFLDGIGNIARDIKRKWNGHSGVLALIIGPCKQDGKNYDLPFLCYQRIAKYLNPLIRIQAPYSTQIHGGNYVKMAKEKKELLYLSRDLMVFGGRNGNS